MYESQISNKNRLILGLLSDIGWILFFTAIVLYMTSGADGLGTVAVSAFFLLTLLSAVIVLIGIVALIVQRVKKLSRRISRRQLITGYGFTVFGALAGCVFSLCSVVIDLIFQYETGICFAAQCLMCAGALLCFVFSLPILRSFKKES